MQRGHLWCRLENESKIDDDIRFIFYKFDKDGNLLEASVTINKFANNRKTEWYMIQKYTNTGIPAPDGYCYQQGDPGHMLRDPENTDLIKKREIIKWKPKR